MTVFENRIRREYFARVQQACARKRSRREKFTALVLVVLVLAVCGFARSAEQKEAQALGATWTPEHRICIVNWADPPMYPVGG